MFNTHIPDNIYRCLPTETFGVREDGTLISGLSLEPFWIEEHDILKEELDCVGSEASVLIPEGGLKPETLYRVLVVNVSRDWETGCIDDCDIKLVEITKPDEIAKYQALVGEMNVE